MKRFFLLASIVVLLCSCGVTKYSQTVYLADFRPFTSDGFTVSPSSSGFTYESVGDISVEFIAGVDKSYTNPDPKMRYNKHWFTPSYDFMVAEIVREAKTLGANALLNFRIINIEGGYVACGFAVKLK